MPRLAELQKENEPEEEEVVQESLIKDKRSQRNSPEVIEEKLTAALKRKFKKRIRNGHIL